MADQLPLHRIPVHVDQFLPQLPAAPHVEIIEPALPERRRLQFCRASWQRQLRGSIPRPPPQSAGDSLLQHLQHLRRSTFRGFADDQMHMLRHHHIPKQLEPVPRTNLPEYLYKLIACASRPQVWPAPVTTKRDEVQIAAPVISLQRIAHGTDFSLRKSQNPHPYKPKGAAPSVLLAANKGPCVNDILPPWPMNQESQEFSAPPARSVVCATRV